MIFTRAGYLNVRTVPVMGRLWDCDDLGQGVILVLTYAISLLLKCAMIILHRTGRYSLFASVFILMLQVAVVTGQNKKGGVTVSYESLGSSRVARFTNSNSFPVRVEFSYLGTRMRGSGEASGEDAVFVAGNYFATYGGKGISITSVRISGVMRSD